MSLVDLPGRLVHGSVPTLVAFTTGALLDSVFPEEMWGFVFKVQRAGNIRSFAISASAVSTAQNMTVGVYNIDASGNPNLSSAYGGMVVGVFTPVVGHQIVTLATDAAATVGDAVAVVIRFESVAGSVNFRSHAGLSNSYCYALVTSNGGTSWTKSAGPIASVIYSDGVYEDIDGMWPFTGGGGNQFSFHSSMNPDEIALLWRAVAKVRVWGFRMGCNTAAAATYNAIIYDANSNVLRTQLMSGSQRLPLMTGATAGWDVVRYASPLEVDVDTVLRFAVEVTTASPNNVSLSYADFGNSTQKGLMYHPDVAWWQRQDGGTWAETPLRVPWIFPIFDRVDMGNLPISAGRPRSWFDPLAA